MQDAAHGEDGRIVPSEEFNYEVIERNVFGQNPDAELSAFTQEEVDRALKVLRMLLEWIWQDGMKNADGVKIRAIIVCWIFLKELRPMNLTEMARGFDLKKQSLGRWVDQFKKDFPAVKTCHMRNLLTDLAAVARRINDREETIGMLKKLALDKAGDALREVLLQGADLLKAKATLRHGQWLPWLAKNCPAVSDRTANAYMRLASNPQRAADFIAAGSIRQALALLEERADGEKKETRQWPPYMESIGRLSKLVGYVQRFPIEKWPREGIEKFREDLQPLAALLWPDKFK